MPGIDPSIIEHETKLYNNAKPIECQIPSLQIVVELLPNTTAEAECLLYLNQLDETHRDVELALEAHKHWVKS